MTTSPKEGNTPEEIASEYTQMRYRTPNSINGIADHEFYHSLLDKINSHCKQQNSSLLEALKECEEYFDKRADADYADEYIANSEMQLLLVVRNAIKQAEQ